MGITATPQIEMKLTNRAGNPSAQYVTDTLTSTQSTTAMVMPRSHERPRRNGLYTWRKISLRMRAFCPRRWEDQMGQSTSAIESCEPRQCCVCIGSSVCACV